jgi:hypothetical protein
MAPGVVWRLYTYINRIFIKTEAGRDQRFHFGQELFA